MHFYEPGPYEELVARLANATVTPKPRVWRNLSMLLDENQTKRQRINVRYVIMSAASFLLVISLSLFLFHSNFLWSGIRFTQAKPSKQSFALDNRLALISIRSALSDESIPLLQFNPTALSPESIKKNLNHDTDSLRIIESPALIRSMPCNLKIADSPLRGSLSLHSRSAILSKIDTTEHLPTDGTEGANGKRKISRTWSILALANPSYSSSSSNIQESFIANRESGALMLGADLFFRKELTPRFFIHTGLSINPIGLNINDLFLFHSNSSSRNMVFMTANTSLGQVTLLNSNVGVSNKYGEGLIPGDVLKSSTVNFAQLKQRFYYIEFPLMFSFMHTSKRVNIEYKLGCSAGFLVSNRYEILSNWGTYEGETQGARTLNASLAGAISFSFPLFNRFSMIVEPNVRLNLSSFQSEPRYSYPYSASVRFGFGYRF